MIRILFLMLCLAITTATAKELPEASIAVVDIDYVMQRAGEQARVLLLLPADMRASFEEIDNRVNTLLRELAATSDPTNTAEITKEIQLQRGKQMTILQQSRSYGGSEDYRTAICTYITQQYSKEHAAILKLYPSQRESSILSTSLTVTNISETVIEDLKSGKH